MRRNMTCGERAVRCLLGQEIDRVPFGVGIGWSAWPETLGRWREESGEAGLGGKPLDEYFSFDKSFIIPDFHAGIFPFFEERTLEETETHIIFQGRDGIIRKQLKNTSNMPDFLSHPVKTREDWERLKSERLRIDTPGRITQNWPAFRARLVAAGEAVQVGAFPFGVFGTVRDLMGAEECLLGFYTEPEMIHDMMQHLTSLWLALWEQVAREVQIDHIHIWEDMSGKQGSLISPKMVEEFMIPCYDRITAFAKDHGVRIISVDTDGDCSELVPIMMRHGINMFFPFEVQAGNDLLAYREKYPTLAMMGGLDKRALALDRAAIDKEVALAVKLFAKGRYIPGFDHAIPPDVPWHNFRYAVECLREVCGA